MTFKGTASSSNQIDTEEKFEKEPKIIKNENIVPDVTVYENSSNKGQRSQFQTEAFDLFGWSKAPGTTEATK